MNIRLFAYVAAVLLPGCAEVMHVGGAKAPAPPAQWEQAFKFKECKKPDGEQIEITGLLHERRYLVNEGGALVLYSVGAEKDSVYRITDTWRVADGDHFAYGMGPENLLRLYDEDGNLTEEVSGLRRIFPRTLEVTVRPDGLTTKATINGYLMSLFHYTVAPDRNSALLDVYRDCLYVDWLVPHVGQCEFVQGKPPVGEKWMTCALEPESAATPQPTVTAQPAPKPPATQEPVVSPQPPAAPAEQPSAELEP